MGVGLFISGIFLVAIATLILDQQAASLSSITVLAFISKLAFEKVVKKRLKIIKVKIFLNIFKYLYIFKF